MREPTDPAIENVGPWATATMRIRSLLRGIVTFGQGVVTGLPDAAAAADPIDLFEAWLDAARRSGLLLPEATALATSDATGAPSVRMVLLKAVDERGFVFYTNYGSRKAHVLDENPRAALAFHWAVLQRQVTIEGPVTRLEAGESAAYFRSRPRGSQVGAWASRQSEPLADRAALEARFRELERRFAGAEVPLPPFWGGYRVRPERIEFWQGRADRLHDRICFTRAPDGWRAERLQP